MYLQVAGFLDNSLVNGTGLRAVLFVSGCRHNCPGCHNKDMQDYSYGDNVDVKEVFDRIKGNPIIRGVTFSGGEPLDQAEALAELAKMIKAEGLSIWCYTGYIYEELLNGNDPHKLELLKHIDVLVDGPFKQDMTQGAQKYTGSSNQRILPLGTVHSN